MKKFSIIIITGLLAGLVPQGLFALEPPQPLAGKGLEYDTPVEDIISGSHMMSGAGGPYPNIRINSDTTTQLQNEEQIVVNPKNTDNVVAVWRDFRLGYRQVGFGYSNDGGYTWTDKLFSGTPYPYDSDPGLTVNAAGTFFAVVLGFNSTAEPNGFFVFRSSDGGRNWDGPFTVIDGVSGVFEDKELIACDRTSSPHAGNLYVVWVRFYSVEIMFTRSTDNGDTWSSAKRIDGGGTYQYPVCAVGANGEVYVAWLSYTGITFDKSLDGGLTFGRDKLVQSTGVYGDLKGGIGVFTYTAMDVDITSGPRRGTIYIAYMDWAPSDTDIYFIKSTDQGDTWSSPVRINDDPVGNGCDQFMPWLFVDEAGVISVIWLDRRLDPDNYLMDCYMTRSNDGGATWIPNERITTVSSDPNAGSKAGLLAEYIGVSGTIDRVNPIWTDTRNGHQDAFTSVMSFKLVVGMMDLKGLLALVLIFSPVWIKRVISSR